MRKAIRCHECGRDKDENFIAKQHSIEIKRMNLEFGWLGRVFGSPQTSPTNICGLIVCLLSGCGIVLMFVKGTDVGIDYFRMIVPVITLTFGYLFGKKR